MPLLNRNNQGSVSINSGKAPPHHRPSCCLEGISSDPRSCDSERATQKASCILVLNHVKLSWAISVWKISCAIIVDNTMYTRGPINDIHPLTFLRSLPDWLCSSMPVNPGWAIYWSMVARWIIWFPDAHGSSYCFPPALVTIRNQAASLEQRGDQWLVLSHLGRTNQQSDAIGCKWRIWNERMIKRATLYIQKRS